MKKNLKNLLLFSILIVVVAGAALALYFIKPAEEEGAEDSSSEVSESVQDVLLSEKTLIEIESVTVQNAEGTFEIVKAEDSSEVSFAAGSANFTIKDFDEEGTNIEKVTTMIGSIFSPQISKSIGEQENLKDFGLSGIGEGKVTLKYEDGTTEDFVIGTDAATGMGKYVLKNGEVHIAGGLSGNFADKAENFLLMDIISVRNREAETEEEKTQVENGETITDLITSLTISGTNFPKQISVSNTQIEYATYRISEPIKSGAASNVMEEIVTALKFVAASGVAKAHYTEEDLKEYNLEEPFAVVEYTMNTEKHTIKVSEKNEDGIRYLIADDKAHIYEVETAAVSAWAETDITTLRAAYIFLPNIMEVKKLTIKENGTETVYNNTRTENEEKSTEDSIAYNLAVKLKDADVDYDKAYQPFYRTLISLAVLSSEEIEYTSTNPVFTVTYEYFGNSDKDTISFYKLGDEDRYVAELNGEFNGIIRKTSLDDVINLSRKMAAGELLAD